MSSFCDTRTCQFIVRILFLVLIVALSAYLFWANERLPDHQTITETKLELKENTIKETFSEPSMESTITEIYMELYSRPPNSKELQFYLEYTADKEGITKSQLKDVIESSSPSLAKSLEVQESDLLFSDTPQNEIFEAYNEILFRNPTPTEYAKYRDLLATAGFDKEKLIQALMSTNEYLRMERTQTNAIYSNLPGGLTDRQITMKITDMYQSVAKTNYIDEDTMHFFKRKFLEMNLNEAEFKLFLQRYVMWSPSAASNSVSNTTTNSNAASNVPPTNNKPSASNAANATTFTGKDKSGNYYNNATIYNIYTVGDSDYMGTPNEQFLKRLQQDSNCSVTGTINEISNDTGNIRNVCPSTNSTELSSYINDRNRDLLKNTCIRNKKFNGMDDDMASIFYTKTFTSSDFVLDPSLAWNVPQSRPPVCTTNARCQIGSLNDQSSLIGTPISDAKDTKVGSILPPFPPS